MHPANRKNACVKRGVHTRSVCPWQRPADRLVRCLETTDSCEPRQFSRSSSWSHHGLTERIRSQCSKMVIRCHTLSIAVPVLKNIAFGLMTETAYSGFSSSGKHPFFRYFSALWDRQRIYPGLVPGIRASPSARRRRGVDGRNKSGHDWRERGTQAHEPFDHDTSAGRTGARCRRASARHRWAGRGCTGRRGGSPPSGAAARSSRRR